MFVSASQPGRLILGLILLCASATAPKAEVDHAAIARAALTEVIRPGYSALAGTTGVLEGEVAALCTRPSVDALEHAKAAFTDTVNAWSKVEILRFGPITQDHRYERLFYWPDPEGIGLRQVQEALAQREDNMTLPDELATKSVALQGLPALEYLLYGDGADVLTKDDRIVDGTEPLPRIDSQGAFRCGFALSIATNISRIARNVVEGWREGTTYEKAFLGPVPDSRLYHTPKEVTLDLFKSFASGIELVRHEKLGKPLGARSADAKPELAAFWRSGLTLANAAGNLEGVRILFVQGGFAQVVAQESPGAEDSILFDLNHAIEVLRGIDQPFAAVVADDILRAKIEAVRVALKSAAQTAGDMISRGAGLSLGFNAIDGD